VLDSKVKFTFNYSLSLLFEIKGALFRLGSDYSDFYSNLQGFELLEFLNTKIKLLQSNLS